MVAQILDGKLFSKKLRDQVAKHVTILEKEYKVTPGLAVVLVGEDPASQVYVRSKGKQTIEAGMKSYEHKLNEDTSEEDILEHPVMDLIMSEMEWLAPIWPMFSHLISMDLVSFGDLDDESSFMAGGHRDLVP